MGENVTSKWISSINPEKFIMDEDLYSFLEKKWRFSNHSKYRNYFKQHVENMAGLSIYFARKDMLKESIDI